MTRDTRISILLAVVACGLIALPFLGIAHIPLTDHPNHMARFHILDAFDSSPELQSLYVLKGGFQPYWGMGGFMAVFTPWLGVETAGQIFPVAALALPVLGTIAINRVVTGKTNATALLAVLFVFSGMAGWGFLNYLFTLGAALLVFAAWIATEARNAYVRIPAFAAAVLTIACMHMISAGMLGLMIGLWEVCKLFEKRRIDWQDIRRCLGIGVVFLPAALLVMSQSASDFGETDTFYAPLSYLSNVMTTPFGFSGSRLWVINWHNLLVVGLYAAFLTYRVFTKSARPVVSFNTRLVAIGLVLFIMGAVTPTTLSGVAYFSHRFPLVGMLFLVASIRVETLPHPRAILGVLVASLLVKMTLVDRQFESFDSDIRELRAASHVMERGNRVFLAWSDGARALQPSITQAPIVHYTHVLGYLVMERDILFPYLFSMFDVGLRPEHARYTVPHDFAEMVARLDTEEARPYSAYWREDFDYIILGHLGEDPGTHIADTRVVHEGSWFKILKVTGAISTTPGLRGIAPSP